MISKLSSNSKFYNFFDVLIFYEVILVTPRAVNFHELSKDVYFKSSCKNIRVYVLGIPSNQLREKPPIV